jgi:inorganic triphosphatase YgiF
VVALEVEAKFSVPDEETFQRLLEADTLGSFRVGSRSVAHLRDRYLDTADRALAASGYACRIRQQNGDTLATLKGRGGVSGAIHRRAEYEVALPGSVPPQEWPPSRVRDLTLTLCADQPLVRIFDVEQIRHISPLYAGDRTVAQLNLDRVEFGCQHSRSPRETTLELEVELQAGGGEADLETLVAELEETWGLVPEGRSKFERGLTLVDSGALPCEEAG